MTSPLEALAGPGKPLKHEPPHAREFANFLRSASVQLRDAANPHLSLDSRFLLTYNAAHSFCLAALRYCGYRPSNRFILFQVLPHTLKLGPEVWRVLAKAHQVRNVSEYEGESRVEERLVTDLLDATRTVAAAVERLPPLA
ncbi:MAG: hypothetical protein WBA53_05395 [Burkholderiaceae bacterium]